MRSPRSGHEYASPALAHTDSFNFEQRSPKLLDDRHEDAPVNASEVDEFNPDSISLRNLELDSEDFYEEEYNRATRVPKKHAVVAVLLIIVGIICVVVGIERIASAGQDWSALLVVGCLTLIPGIYQAVIIGKLLWRGHVQFVDEDEHV